MERLTFEGNFCDIAQCQENPCPYNGSCSQREVWERLEEYEDTGLEPAICANYKIFEDEAISKGVTFKRIVALMEADRTGRLVVLLCKVGDTVYVNGEKRTVQATIDEAYLNAANGIEYLVSFICNESCDGCPFNSWHQDYDGEYSCNGEWGQASIMGADFGKTVFLTREEAEEALRRAENG